MTSEIAATAEAQARLQHGDSTKAIEILEQDSEGHARLCAVEFDAKVTKINGTLNPLKVDAELLARLNAICRRSVRRERKSRARR